MWFLDVVEESLFSTILLFIFKLMIKSIEIGKVRVSKLIDFLFLAYGHPVVLHPHFKSERKEKKDLKTRMKKMRLILLNFERNRKNYTTQIIIKYILTWKAVSNKFLLDFFAIFIAICHTKVLVVCLKFVLLLVYIAYTHIHTQHTASWTESNFQSRSIQNLISTILNKYFAQCFSYCQKIRLHLLLTYTAHTNFYNEKFSSLILSTISFLYMYIYIYYYYKNSVCISC